MLALRDGRQFLMDAFASLADPARIVAPGEYHFFYAETEVSVTTRRERIRMFKSAIVADVTEAIHSKSGVVTVETPTTRLVLSEDVVRTCRLQLFNSNELPDGAFALHILF